MRTAVGLLACRLRGDEEGIAELCAGTPPGCGWYLVEAITKLAAGAWLLHTGDEGPEAIQRLVEQLAWVEN